MLRTLVFLSITVAAAVCVAHDPASKLPSPRYRPKTSDPAWLTQTVQFHGHLGPWIVVGARLGIAGAKAVDAKEHFDVDVTCAGPFQKPPQSCFLDGVQVATGATLGKRTIHTLDAKEVVLTVRNLRTDKAVEVRPTQKLMDMLKSLAQESAKKSTAPGTEEIEQIARDIAAMPDKEILTISP